MDQLIKEVEKEYLRRKLNFSPGDTVKVHVKVREKKFEKKKEVVKERIQIFEGIVIAIRGSGTRQTFTVRKISSGIAVERIFPLQSPNIEKIEVVRRGKVRRAKLYYLREKVGKDAKIKERFC